MTKVAANKKKLRTTTRASNSLDPDKAQHFVGPDLGSNCLQMLSADNSPLAGRVNFHNAASR